MAWFRAAIQGLSSYLETPVACIYNSNHWSTAYLLVANWYSTLPKRNTNACFRPIVHPTESQINQHFGNMMTPRVSCEFPSNLLQTCELTYLSEYKKKTWSRIYPKISCFKIHQCSIIMLPQFNVALFETWGYYQMAIFIGFHDVLKIFEVWEFDGYRPISKRLAAKNRTLANVLPAEDQVLHPPRSLLAVRPEWIIWIID